LSTTNGTKPREETFFARKPEAQIHEFEQPRNPYPPFQEGKVTC